MTTQGGPTAPKANDTDEQTARAAAEEYADKLFPCTKPCDKYGVCEGCSERLIFDSGKEFGRREGLEEAAKIADSNERNGYLHGCQCGKDIRAAAKKEKPHG